MGPRRLSYLLVLIQLVSLGVIALTGPWFARNPVLFIMQIVAVMVALWAIASIRLHKLSIFPDVPEDAEFVRRGPYKIIRHPMYASLLLATLPAVAATPTPLRMAAWIVLLIDILVKVQHEERLLTRAFTEYERYRQETKRLIPLVY